MAEYTLRQLEYFVAVAEAGSVTGAATRVHLSQSAMSTAIADLERAFDVQLLLRHHARGVTLTPAGEQLIRASRRLLSQAEELVSEARGLGRDLAGSLAVGCFSVLAPYVVPEILATCAECYPSLRLCVHEVDLGQLADGIIAGQYELGLGYDLAPDPRLVMTRMFTLPPYVLLPAGHRLTQRPAITLEELAAEPLALLDLPQSRDYFEGMFAAACLQPDVRYRSNSVETLRAIVGRGLACTLLNLEPKVSMSLDGNPVVSVPLKGGGTPLDVVLVHAASGRPTRRAAAVSELCTEVLRRRGSSPATP